MRLQRYLPRYDAIVDLTRVLNSSSSNPRDTQIRTRQILLSLFPPWLPPAFKVSCLNLHVLPQKITIVVALHESQCWLYVRPFACFVQWSRIYRKATNLRIRYCAGDVLQASTWPVLPAQCVGDHADLSVADGSLQGAASVPQCSQELLTHALLDHFCNTIYSMAQPAIMEHCKST